MLDAPVELAVAVGERAVLPVSAEGRPTWTKWYEIFRVVGYRPYLKRTLTIALIVGSVLFIINHLDEVLSGKATARVYAKGALTYLVPFIVSNSGLLVAARRPRHASARMLEGNREGEEVG
jgi:hypothetical protein